MIKYTPKPRTIDHENSFITFMKWMKSNGFRKSKCLRPAIFLTTDRGIMAGEKINKNDCLISVPYNLLITTSTVMHSKLGEHLKNCGETKFLPQQILALFLAVERRNGETSFWKPYLDVLPKSYPLPIFWEKNTSFMPNDFKPLISDQRKKLTEAYKGLDSFLKEMEHIRFIPPPKISFDEFLWGWFTVHTRAVHFQQPPNPLFNHEKDNFALAPFLDFFNHSPHSKMKAGFNFCSQCYEITTLESYNKFDEVFFNYGSHDNLKLLLDYGFTTTMNPYSYVSFTIDEIVEAALEIDKIDQFKTKVKLLKNHDLLKFIRCGLTGVSWNMMAVVRILILNVTELKNWFYYLADNICQQEDKINTILRLCLQRKLDLITNEMSSTNSIKSSQENVQIASIYEERKVILQNTLTSFQN